MSPASVASSCQQSLPPLQPIIPPKPSHVTRPHVWRSVRLVWPGDAVWNRAVFQHRAKRGLKKKNGDTQGGGESVAVFCPMPQGGGRGHRMSVKCAVTSGRRREATALDNDPDPGRRRGPDRISLPVQGRMECQLRHLQGGGEEVPRLTTKIPREEERVSSYSVR